MRLESSTGKADWSAIRRRKFPSYLRLWSAACLPRSDPGSWRELGCHLHETFDLLIQIAVSHSWKFRGFFRGEFRLRKRTGPQSEEKKSRRTLDCGVPHVHARQLRALLEHLDVACGGAATSTNGERSMRPRGTERSRRAWAVGMR